MWSTQKVHQRDGGPGLAEGHTGITPGFWWIGIENSDRPFRHATRRNTRDPIGIYARPAPSGHIETGGEYVHVRIIPSTTEVRSGKQIEERKARSVFTHCDGGITTGHGHGIHIHRERHCFIPTREGARHGIQINTCGIQSRHENIGMAHTYRVEPGPVRGRGPAQGIGHIEGRIVRAFGDHRRIPGVSCGCLAYMHHGHGRTARPRSANGIGIVTGGESGRIVDTREDLVARCGLAPCSVCIGRTDVGKQAHRGAVRTEGHKPFVASIRAGDHVHRDRGRVRITSQCTGKPIPELVGAGTGALGIEVLPGKLAGRVQIHPDTTGLGRSPQTGE